MSSIERLLAFDCTDGPECRCGEEMQIAGVEILPDRTDAQIRVYRCSTCQHEMRLTVWSQDLLVNDATWTTPSLTDPA
jgi:hypothetical protein